MKRNTLTLFVIFLITATFLSSCKKDKYPPSLTLELEPYVVYHNNIKYVLYDAQGNRDDNIKEEVYKQGDIQQYIDTKTLLKYTLDDNGEFWSAEYLNATYNYPTAVVKSYSGTKIEPVVTIDEEIGIENESGIDLGKAGLYTFTYTATDEGKTSTKKVHLRVYNSYSNLNGIYVSKLSRLNSGGGSGVSLWTEDYGYGESKVVTFSVDEAIDKKFSINRFLNNRNLKGTVKGEEVLTETHCTLGARRGEASVIVFSVKGNVVDNDKYIAQVINATGTDQPDTIPSLIVVTNLMESNKTTGRLTEVSVQDANNQAIDIPIISIEYTIRRYKRNDNYASSDQYNYGGITWEPLDSPSQNWDNNFRETFVKQVYWTDENKDAINNASGH